MDDIVFRAMVFARIAHEGQYRKYTGQHYTVHTRAVADLVASVGGDPEMVAAAELHDVVEDTDVTLDEIREKFGNRVASLVEGLTDVSKPEDGNRATRKAIDREHTKNAGPDVHTIKLADALDNGQDIVQNDPDFAVVYMREMELLVPFLSDGNPILYAKARKMLDDYRVMCKV